MSELFQIDQQRTFTRPVTFNMPAETGNGNKQFRVSVDFVWVDKDQFEEMQENSIDREILEEVVKGVGGVQDSNGDEIRRSDAIEPMLKVGPFVYEAARVYLDVMVGGNLPKKTSGKRRRGG